MDRNMDMEFATEEEARDYTGSAYGYHSGFGFVQVGENKDTSDMDRYVNYLNEAEAACYVVMTEVQGRYMYAKKRGITYIQSEAQLFTLKEAEQRAKYRTKNGAYTWFKHKVL